MMAGGSGQTNTAIAVFDPENVIFTFKVNKKFSFTKTLKEVEKFCKDYVE